MKKILIISDLFYPSNQIGALRPTKIAKFLKEKGYEVDVFTRYSTEYNEKIMEICNKIDGFEKRTIGVDHTNKKNNTKRKNGRIVLEIKLLYRQFLLMKKCKSMLDAYKALLKSDENYKRYDIVFSTFGPISSLWCGRIHKNYYPTVKWICDFRDPIAVEFTPKLLWPYFKHMEKVACKEADAVVTVSKGYMQRICPKKYLHKTYMIPNGYDVADMTYSLNNEPPKNVIRFTYVGAMYEGKRDLSPVFRAIKELADEGKVDLKKIQFCYAGTDMAYFKSQAEKYHIEGCIVDKGRLARPDCLALQFSSHFLLLSTWNSKNEYGVFPGKFLEYMLIRKPIISVVDGNLPNSEVSEVIEEGNLGVAYEAARDRVDYIKLKAYLEKQYLLFSSKQELIFEPKEEVIGRYNYHHIIKQLEGVING